MRKIVAALLVAFILGSSIPSGLAQDYHRQVLEYLAGQLQVGEEDIHLEGNLMELPLSGEQLWAGRYFLKEEGEKRAVIRLPGREKFLVLPATMTPEMRRTRTAASPAAH